MNSPGTITMFLVAAEGGGAAGAGRANAEAATAARTTVGVFMVASLAYLRGVREP